MKLNDFINLFNKVLLFLKRNLFRDLGTKRITLTYIVS
jgi:hypothetical protein